MHSASSHIAMRPSRTQVSMAEFFDWSTEEFDDVSIPSIYQKLAMTQKNKYNKNNKSWCSEELQLNPGREFVRDKAKLTKGEREIVEGIYKNRGDITEKNNFVTHIRSHKHVWLVGKHSSKRGTTDVKCSCKCPAYLLFKADDQKDFSRAACQCCYNCIHGEEHCTKTLGNWKKIESIALQSSPNNSPKTHRKEQLQQKFNAGEGGIFIESGKTFLDSTNGAKKKKIYVDIFLPTLVSTLQEEVTFLPLNDASDE